MLFFTMKISLFTISYLLLLLVLAYIGLSLGSYQLSFADIRTAVFEYNVQDISSRVVIDIRLPRLIQAFLVGACLAFSGYLMQVLVNNPLADPYILGTSSGAALGANLVFLGLIPWGATIFMPSLMAFVGAFGVTVVVVIVARDKGRLVPSKVLLSGIALSSLLVALMSMLIFIAGEGDKLKTVVLWTLGSFAHARWDYIPLLLIATVVCLGAFLFMGKQLNLLYLGESRAKNLGLNVTKFRYLLLFFAAIATAVAVATSGPIGFVGLIVPHFVRGLFRVTGKWNIVFTVLVGGGFMLLCDIVSRLIYPPSGLPIGVITSFVGIPFFVYLLWKNYRFN